MLDPNQLPPDLCVGEDIKWIPDYEGRYAVTSQGRVSSALQHNGTPGRWLKPRLTPDGYHQVALYRDKRTYYRYIHRLVWEAFRGKIQSGYEIDHHNGVKIDNRLENLNCLSRSAHCAKDLRGERHGSAKLTTDQVKAIRTAYAKGGRSAKNIGAEYGIGKTQTLTIIHRQAWTHI